MKPWLLLLFWLLAAFSALRAQAPGTPDASFGTAGWTVLDLDDYDAPVAVRANARRIVVAGNIGHQDTVAYDMDGVMAAFDLEGEPDLGFGVSGVQRFDFPGKYASTLVDMVAMPDGGWAVLGYGTQPNDARQEFCVLRTDSLGQPIGNFGNGGFLHLPFIGNYNIPEKIAATPDGRILIAGSTYDSTMQHIEYPCVAMLRGDGSRDSSFGGTGELLLNYATGFRNARVTHSNGGSFYDVVMMPDGRILCGGSALGAAGYNCALSMLLPDGTPDSSFYGSGILTWDNAPGCNNYVQSVVPLANGDIALQIKADCWYMAADQYYQRLPLGGEPGDLLNLDGGVAERCRRMADDGRGGLLLTGPAVDFGQPTGWYSDRYSMVRVAAGTGQPDLGFGASGWFQAVPNAPEQSGAEAIAVQPDGKVLLAGFVNLGDSGNLSEMRVVRLLGGSAVTAPPPAESSPAKLVAFPNPVQAGRSLEVRWTAGQAQFSLWAMDGRCVRRQEGSDGMQVDLSGLASGTYLLRADSRTAHASLQVVVQ